jgi:uncharacterized protein YndB with AHSA1/START domain
MNKPVNLIPPVAKNIIVARAQADAFRLYTEEFGKWWPFATHSLGGDKVETATMETRLGGRIFERWKDGSLHHWGEILAWEPPHRVVHSWHVGHPAHEASEVELRFVALSPRLTRVELEHRHWEKMSGEKAREVRERYDNGWETVLIKGFGAFAGSAEEQE